VQPGFHNYTVFDGLDRPTSVEFSPDGRVFVTEKRGTVQVFDGLDDPTPSLVADLRNEVYNNWDRGLLGLALHPQFPSVPWIYVAYTLDALPGGTAPRWGVGTDVDPCPTPPGLTADGCVVTGRVSRLQVGADGTVTAPEQVLVQDWCQQFPSHSVGTILFGADGALYAGGGDGASFNFADYGQTGIPKNPCGDPGANTNGEMRPPAAEGGALRSMDLRTSGDPVGLNGTIIRIDPVTGAARATNPLATSTDLNARRVVAYGLRNPFRFTMRPGTNDLWIADVGWNRWEEIDVSKGDDTKVDNFAWPCYEGSSKQRDYDNLDVSICEGLYATGGKTSPFYKFEHGKKLVDSDTCPTNRGSSISGVAFAEPGNPYPADYAGALFFADAARSCIYVMKTGTNGLPSTSKVSKFPATVGTPVELEIGPGGELWYVDLYEGKIHRLGYSSTNAAPQAAFSASTTSGDPPLSVAFDARESTDTDTGDTLRYAWDLDGDADYDDGTEPTVTMSYETVGTRTVRLKVTDAAGATDTAQQTIRVGTAAPVPVIAAPGAGTTTAVGATVPFSGSASVLGTELPESALSWSLDLLHCPTVDGCHRHPDLYRVDDKATGSFIVPDHEYPSHVELLLTATWDGETVTTTRRVDFTAVNVTLAANTTGVSMSLAGATGSAPLTRPAPQNGVITIAAPATVTNSSGTWAFASWSDGGARSHSIVVPASATTLTARYVPA
jgi:glucose/arabinose dehydrogenase